jgi:hypothetical protein
LASYSLRYPNLVKKGTIDPTALDARMLEDERLRVLTVERLVLETICFKFGVDSALSIVIKIAKALECEFSYIISWLVLTFSGQKNVSTGMEGCCGFVSSLCLITPRDQLIEAIGHQHHYHTPLT